MKTAWTFCTPLCVIVFVLGLAAVPSNAATTEKPGGPTFLVNSTLDLADINPGDGICEATVGAGNCTLRAAFMEAEYQAGSTISIPAGTYLLTIPSDRSGDGAHGGLILTRRATISGAGSGKTIIDGNKSVVHDRVLILGVYGASATTIQGLTIRNGELQDDSGAGLALMAGDGLHVEGHYVLNDVEIANNSVTHVSNIASGAGLYLYGYSQATFSLTQVKIHDNTVTTNGPAGAGILIDTPDVGWASQSTSVTIVDSVISGNQATGVTQAARGGGISISNGNLTLLRTTVSNNSAGYGGGIQVDGSYSSCTLVNSTISGNQSNADGGGMDIANGAVKIYSSTILGNYSDWDLNGVGKGGGIFQSGGSVHLGNSIVAGNYESLSLFPPGWLRFSGDLRGTYTSDGYNAIKTPLDSTINGLHNLDLPAITLTSIGLLAMNGGYSPTHALAPGNQAINAANPAGCKDQNGAVLTTDQRGLPRSVGGRCDVGAYETEYMVFTPTVMK